MQNPPSGVFYMELVWIDHVTNDKGKYKTSMFFIILWEQQHSQSQCKYIKEILRVNLLNSLRIPCADSLTFLLGYSLFPMFFI